MKQLLIIISLMLATQWGIAQNDRVFIGTVSLGMNAAQVQGDLLAGYHKLGLHAATEVFIKIKKNQFIGIGLTYDQRGARNSLNTGNVGLNPAKLDFEYVTVPLTYHIRDWYIEDGGFYRVGAYTGLGYGRLFRSAIENSSHAIIQDKLIPNELHYIFGLLYRFNKRWEFNMAYTRSWTPLFSMSQHPVHGLNSLFPYQITSRIKFYF